MKIIKVNKRSYFYDKNTGEPVKFDPSNLDIEFKYQDSGYTIHVSNQNINIGKPLGIYFVDPSGEPIAIDDGYQQELVYCGYLINGLYDQIQEQDQTRGIKTRENICTILSDTIQKYIQSGTTIKLEDTIEKVNNNISCKFSTPDGYTGTIEFKTISNIVNQNKFRREFDLQFYPYLKYMDKYNSYYISIFIDNNGEEYKGDTIIFDAFVDELLKMLKEDQDEFNFHVKTMPIKQRIIKWKNYNAFQDKSRKTLNDLLK